MATKGKKPRAKWDSETEKRLIDVWADILEEFGGKMLKRKKKRVGFRGAWQTWEVQ